MQSKQPSLFARDDTLLGVCEAIGEDFGFNPLYLRVALGVMMIWAPVAVITAYVAAGAVVLLSRLVFPKPRHAGAAVAAQPARPLEGDNEAEAMAVAA